ncbi:MAG: epoxyqueuosine reductase QueH [Candidatus Marinimicrobia bacterium]|nr:epoxyqueuosine reductase QueH [Candidatus Neomarinimicrobiota bacterium]
MEQHEHSNPRYPQGREHRPMTRILLHTCCAVCAAACTERLRQEGLEPVLFFSNSNIYPREEYERRLAAAKKLAELQDLELVLDDYDHEAWREAVKGLEQEPEKGRVVRSVLITVFPGPPPTPAGTVSITSLRR